MVKKMMERAKRAGTRRRAALAAGVGVISSALIVQPALATGPTYDISPVTTSITSELAANLPTILGIVGGLIALGLAVRAVKKFAHV